MANETEKKVLENEEVKEEKSETNPVIETKPTFKQKLKKFWDKAKKPVLIVGAAGLTIAGGVLVDKMRKEKNAEIAELKADREKLAEDWFNRGMLAAHPADDPDPEPEEEVEAIEADYEEVE